MLKSEIVYKFAYSCTNPQPENNVYLYFKRFSDNLENRVECTHSMSISVKPYKYFRQWQHY